MSDEPTSVRPELLEGFASASLRIEGGLETSIASARRAVAAFLAGTDPGLTTSQPDLIHGGLSDITNRLADTRRFATLLREAVLAADVQGGGGAVTLTSAQLMAGLSDSARREFELLLTPTPLPPIDPPTLGTIPEDSGLVDDPVCTATGHFLEDELDLVVPERVVAFGWQRRYSSRQLDVNAHGPGWWTWADVVCRADGDAVLVVCPDGRHLRFPRPVGGAVGAPDTDATLEGTGGGGWIVRWGLRHREGPQTWHFDPDGRPHLIDASLGGRTVLEHDEAGRLVTMTHDGGRALRLEWADDRIAAVHDSHGRTARYRYVDGHLAEVVRDSGGRTYATDVHGRIVEVVDADGVTLARNRYDAEGRVVRQVAPTGRVTVFRYEPGRRTAVLDGAGDLVVLYAHDHRGRVEAMVSPHGAELTRTFDRDGRVASLLAQDGSGFTSEGVAGPDGVLRITHHDGRVEQIDHDHLGRVIRHELVGAGATTFEYEGDSICPRAITSPAGARRTMRWEDGGVLVEATDADGVRVELEVDGDGLPRSATDGAGHTVLVDRSPAGVARRIDLPDGGRIEAEIDAAGRVHRITGPTGDASSLRYSAAGRLLGIVDADGTEVAFRYGDHGFLESATDQLGRAVRFEVDEWGRPVTLGPDGRPGWRLGWSPLGVLTDVTTPGGARWHQELDDRHRVAGVEDPDGRTETHEHDGAGRTASVRHPAAEVHVGFDEAGRVDAVTELPGGSTTITRDDDGRAVATVDADGVRTSITYTPSGRLAAQQIGDAAPLTVDHDAAGEVAAVHHAGATWRVARDWRGAATTVTAPSGRQVRIDRDALGRPIEVDRAGVVERWEYDRRGHVVGRVAPTGATLRIDRDPAGRVVSVEGPGGRTELEHDVDAGTTASVDPLGGRSQVRSDADGHVRERTDPLDRTTTFERSPGGALQAVVDPDGHRLGFEHDEAGRVTAAYDDGTALARYRYERGQLAEVEEPGRGRRTHFELTPAGRLRAWRDDAGREAAVERDAAGRIVARRGDLLPTTSWTHDAWARRGEVDGRAVAVELDLDGVLSRVAVGARTLEIERAEAGEVASARWTDGTVERHLALTRDGAGRVVDAVLDGRRSTYTYDEADRLVAWAHEGRRTEWEHDGAGRLVAERVHTDDGTHERRFTYDAAHQLVAIATAAGSTELRYDGAGRRVAEHRPDGSVRRYEWDALGRLRAVVDGDERTEVDIDCFGRLRGVGGTELRWDLSAGNPELAAVGDTAVVASGAIALAAGEDLLVDQLLGPVATGTHPFGSAPDDGSVSLACGLPGGVAFAGLIWLGDRVLDPATGQFLTPDPLAASIGSPTQAFPYAYADGDPVNRADPSGRSGQPISIADFEAARQRSMGMQWGNIATVAVIAGGAVLAATGVGLVGMAIGGAVLGGIQAGAMSHQETGSVNPREVVVGALFGAAGGAVSAKFGNAARGYVAGRLATAGPTVQRASTTVGGRMVTTGFSSAMTDLPVHLAHEGADAYFDGRSYSASNVLVATGGSFAGGFLEEPAGAVVNRAKGMIGLDAPALSSMPQTPMDPPPAALPAPEPRPALPAPEPRAALPAPEPRAALPAPEPRAALPAAPTPSTSSSLVVATPSLSLPSAPTGFVPHPSGLYVPQ